MAERTFAIIKPDATARNLYGPILSRIAEEGFAIKAMRLVQLTASQAEGFYAEHAARPFFRDLIAFMTSGPVVLLCLEREDAVAHWRAVMGDTNPEKAAAGTIRKQFGESIERNSTHGSDSPTSAARELNYWFGCFDFVG